MMGPVSCGGPLGGWGMLKGLLGFVIMGQVLGNAGCRDAMSFKHLLLSCGASSVVGIGVVGF